jgi:hypothetical protein
MWPSENESVEDPCEYMSLLAQELLPLSKWGFKESYRSNRTKDLIYDSEWCRVSFGWLGWDYMGGNSISINYGRLHASNDKGVILWNGEECHCWHREELALHFLDSNTPEYSAKRMYSHTIKEKFRQSELGQSLTAKRSQPEWLIRTHNAIWEQYAPRLFELFDLRRPSLWVQYRKFLKEVYDIKGRNPDIKPSEDNIC